jgi:ATP-dependent RNA helicase DDX56/DBP9
MSIDRLTHLILDEADLVLSYGYSEDLENLSRSVPKGVQVMMMSATLSDEVNTLKGIFRRDPTLLDLKEKEVEGEGITQFVAK